MVFAPIFFCSVTQSCLTLCNPMDCSTLGFPVHHQLPELAQTMSIKLGCHPTISSSVVPFSSCLQSFPATGSFRNGGQSIGATASASVLFICVLILKLPCKKCIFFHCYKFIINLLICCFDVSCYIKQNIFNLSSFNNTIIIFWYCYGSAAKFQYMFWCEFILCILSLLLSI